MQRRGVGCGCFGCGGTFLLTLAVLGALAWFFVLKPARDFVAGWQTPPAQTTQTQAPPPPSGNVNAPLTEADVQKFVRVRRKVRDALGSSFTSAQQVFSDLQAGQNVNIGQVLTVLRETGSSIGQARAAQTAALSAEKMSLERYATVRAGVNRALGLPNVDVGRVAQDLQQGKLPDLNSSVQSATGQEKALVKPFENELRTTAAAGLLGL